jgi:hypothetical protein
MKPFLYATLFVAGTAIYPATAMAQAVQAPVKQSLYVVQQCASLSQGGRCQLSFVQMPQEAKPSEDIERTCATGWLARITAQRGTVERGGINRGQAVVCGYAEPAIAIRGLLLACDEQTLGICQDANQIDVQWAYWSDVDPAIAALASDQPLALNQLPQYHQCVSAVPIQESQQCPPEAAVLLRSNGMR